MRISEPSDLRVAVNAYFARHPLTGSGQYLDRLLGAFHASAINCELLPLAMAGWRRAVVSRQNRGDGCSASPTVRSAAPCAPPGGREGGELHEGELSPAMSSSPANDGPSTVRWLRKLWFEQVSVPRSASSLRSDLVHYPYWAAPLVCAVPAVVTVHDLIPLVLEPYRGSRQVRAYAKLQAIASRRATMLIADSQATKRDIVSLLGVGPERVRVIYLAADERFQSGAGLGTQTDVRARYGLPERFFFYAGGLDIRKNLSVLLAAFARAKSQLPDCVVAIAGDHRRRGPLFPDLESAAVKLGLEDSVKFLGAVPEADLPVLYQCASAVAFPSTYEGFGLPPLEALASGAAVLCSNASSLPEVVGDAALLLDPQDEEAWAGGLVRVMKDESLRLELKRRGPRQASRFSWATTAAETAAVYREAVDRWHHRLG